MRGALFSLALSSDRQDVPRAASRSPRKSPRDSLQTGEAPTAVLQFDRKGSSQPTRPACASRYIKLA